MIEDNYAEIETWQQAAVAYARRGLRIIPLHGIIDGHCTCHQAHNCHTPGKHPIWPRWTERATSDITEIQKWKLAGHAHNIGIATGIESGIIVLDIDPQHGGEESLEKIIAEHGALPDTLQATTGGGGRHYYFRHPGGSIKNVFRHPSAIIKNIVGLLPGIDIRGDGGMVVAPPSMHISGRRYDWDGLRGFSEEILPAPEWLLKLIHDAHSPSMHVSKESQLGTPILEGQRNTELARIAGAMRRRGCTATEIETALRAINEERCNPPLSEDEVHRIALSISRYNPGEIAAARACNLIEFPLTDAGNAERLHALYGEYFRYSHPQRTFFIWDGSRWIQDDRGILRHFARETARALFTQAWDIKEKEQQDALIKHARHCECSQAITNMLKEAACIPGVPVLPAELDSDPWLLNVANGTIDLRTGELRPHRREDLITRLAPVEYDPSARSSLWERFLDEATGGDKELQNFLQRAVGYSLTGDIREEKLFFVHGPTAAGKSTFLEAIKSALGDYAKTADFESFIARRDVGTVRNDIAELAGRRFVLSIEVDEGKKLAEGLIKLLTGGDTIRARFLYQESFEFLPQFKLWLAANHAPKVRHDDSALWRRILRIPFEQVVPRERRDPSLKARLKDVRESGPAILAWAVEGCLRWQEDGLGIPETVEKATEQYRLDMDPLRDFIADCCVLDENAWISTSKLRQAYEEYCKENGDKYPLGANNFALCLKSYGCQPSKRNGIRGWQGIGLNVTDHHYDAPRYTYNEEDGELV